MAERGNKLVATTAWRLRVLTLEFLARSVVVDPKKKVVTVRARLFWLLARNRCLKFSAIEAVTYSYRDWAPGFGGWGHRSADVVKVGLRLYEHEDVRLFYFFGDGEFTNDGPLPNWLYWDHYLFDLAGDQQKESRAYVDV